MFLEYFQKATGTTFFWNHTPNVEQLAFDELDKKNLHSDNSFLSVQRVEQ